MKKIVFLDIDGVLTTARSCEAYDNGFWVTPDPVAARLVTKLCQDTLSKIVISSTWRCHFNKHNLSFFLQSNGIPMSLLHENWDTPKRMDSHRGREIREWLEKNTVDKYVILDDDSDMLEPQLPNFVKTDPLNGFLWDHYMKAQEILK